MGYLSETWRVECLGNIFSIVVGLAVNTLTIITRRIENSNTHQAEFHILIALPHLIGGGKICLIIAI